MLKHSHSSFSQVKVAQRGEGDVGVAVGVLGGGNNMADQEHYIICNLDVVIDEFRCYSWFAFCLCSLNTLCERKL